jgi:hypothetical protein
MDETLNGFLVAARENEAESLNENTQMVCLLEKMTAALRDAAGLNPDLTRKGLNPLEAILLANLCRDVQPDFEVGPIEHRAAVSSEHLRPRLGRARPVRQVRSRLFAGGRWIRTSSSVPMEPQGGAPISKFAPDSPLEEADSNLRSPG